MAGAAADIDGAPPAREHGPGDRTNDGVGDDVGGIGEAIEKIAAFETRSQRVDEIAVGGGAGRGGFLERGGLPIVVQAQHRAARQRRLSGLDLIAGQRGVRLQVQDRDPGHDRKDAAVAPEDAVFDLVAVPAVEQGGDELEAAATERAAENVERRDVHR